MPAAPLPPDEAARLAALRRCRVMDTPPEATLDALTHQAREICGAPMATLSLVDDRRQWFKSRAGVSWTGTPRDESFCAHALLNPRQPLIVPDATADPRFADNPAVTGQAKIRFYAGVPLLSPEGHPLGTLCVYDRTPRELSAEQVSQLSSLTQQAAHLLSLRRRVPTERRLALGFAATL
ncbi:MAG: GAF domain-containing protein, partial [Rhodospirillales bacterium]|nr:GAF domain-containing protein [Acetobacter sp.]